MFQLIKAVNDFKTDLFLMWAIITGVLAFLSLIGILGWGITTLIILTSFLWMTVTRGMMSTIEERLDYVEEAKETQTKE